MSIIKLSPEVALKLETTTTQMRGKEFSGIGFVAFKDGDFNVYDVLVISAGSEAYTEIPSAKLLPIMARPDYPNMKLWFHRHGVGNGVPGSHNWSGTDSHTAREEPLGCPVGMAHLVKWSISIVRTPFGWVGRYDKYTKGEEAKTTHMRVTPSYAQNIETELEPLRQAYSAVHGHIAYETHRSFVQRHNAATRFKSPYQYSLPGTTAMGALYQVTRDFDPDLDLRESREQEIDMNEVETQVLEEIDGMGYFEARDYLERFYPYIKTSVFLETLGMVRPHRAEWEVEL